MKKILILSLFLCFNVTVFSQSIFEENGKFGIKGKSGSIIIKANYERILKTESNALFLLVQPNPDYSGKTEKHDAEQLADIRFWSSATESYPLEQFKFLPSKKYGAIRVGWESTVLPCEFSAIIYHRKYIGDDTGGTEKHYFFVKKDNEYTLFQNGTKVDSVSFDSHLLDLQGFWFRKSGKWSFYNEYLKKTTSESYDKIEVEAEIMADIYKNPISEEPTAWGSTFYKGKRYMVENDKGKQYLRSIKGDVFPEEYSLGKRKEPNGNWMIKTAKGKYGVGNSYLTRWLIEPKYTKLKWVGDGKYEAVRNGKTEIVTID